MTRVSSHAGSPTAFGGHPALAIALCVLLSAPTARAEDWLALHPECAFDPEAIAPGRMAILYPRAGLPALVEQGTRLVTRVRVPSGLTPPPGIQQDRALVGWSAELVGYGIPLGTRVSHRYPLRVVDVRPDGPSSLVYRASIEVPAWAVPGTYALRMTAPGGADAVAGGVRVLGQGNRTRVALAGAIALEGSDPTEALRRLSARLGHAPVDAWIVPHDRRLLAALENAPLPGPGPDGEMRPPPPPIVLLPDDERGLAVALRRGDDTLVLGACDDRFVRFEEQLEGTVEAEGRAPRRIASSDLPPAGMHVPLADPPAAPRPVPASGVVIERQDGNALSLAATGDGAAELVVLVPDDGHATAVEGAEPGWWPATPFASPGALPTVAVWLPLQPGETTSLRRGEPSPLELDVRAEPSRVETGIRVRLTATPSREATLLAWQLDEDLTTTGAAASRAWAPLGPHRVAALAIAPDGVAARAETTVQVRTREKSTCDCGAAPGTPSPPAITGFLPLAAFVVFRARRRRNIRAPGRRSDR